MEIKLLSEHSPTVDMAAQPETEDVPSQELPETADLEVRRNREAQLSEISRDFASQFPGQEEVVGAFLRIFLDVFEVLSKPDSNDGDFGKITMRRDDLDDFKSIVAGIAIEIAHIAKPKIRNAKEVEQATPDEIIDAILTRVGDNVVRDVRVRKGDLKEESVAGVDAFIGNLESTAKEPVPREMKLALQNTYFKP